ncbi:MAG: protease modulator HflC [Lachnospiraceae bacterium]|nr:protease modulator HflC [Lachnospiraceae bacterium]
MKKFVKVLIGLVVLVGVLLITGCFFTVKENEYAVVTQFGRIVRVESEAGLKFKIPFIQDTSYLPKAVQLYDLYPSDVITRDRKSMIADDYVMWKITDPVKFMQTLNGSTSAAEDRVSVAVYNATKSIISSMSQEEIISARGNRLTQIITEESNSDIGQYGVVILTTQIKALDLPDDNKDAVYERMISERNNVAASYRAQGESEAQKIRNETDRTVSVMRAEAQKQADILVAEGESEYMQTLQDAYNTEDKAEFYSFIRSLDALKASLAGGNKTILLDKDSELVRLLYGAD